MKENQYVLCAYRPWNIALFHEKLKKLPYSFHLFCNKDDLTFDVLQKINPTYIFFLDWSWIVPKEIISNYVCVGFHAAPLPEFRGGSPVQNQIIRGVTNTKLTAFFMDEGIDTGDILIQKPLSLKGHLSDIFTRISDTTFPMIQEIIKGEFTKQKQRGKGSYYPRRQPQESELYEKDFNKPLSSLYDFIRMLEDPYPNAFVNIGDKKIVFKSADYDLKTQKIKIVAEIIQKS